MKSGKRHSEREEEIASDAQSRTIRWTSAIRRRSKIVPTVCRVSGFSLSIPTCESIRPEKLLPVEQNQTP
jgi:hypothetical protein